MKMFDVRGLIFGCLGGALCLAATSCAMPDSTSLWVPKEEAPEDLAPMTFARTPEVKEGEAKEGELTPLVMSVQDASLLALQHNASFQVERMNPAINHAAEMQARAAFDPTVNASASITETTDVSESETNGAFADLDTTGTSRKLSGGFDQTLPTGTNISVSLGRDIDATLGNPENSDNYTNQSQTNTADMTITQSLLRGFGPAVNLASLRSARLDTRISRYVLEGAAESLIYQTEVACWDYLLAQRQIEIYEEALKVSETQLKQVRERIDVGSLADIELAAVQAELAQSREDLINARSSFAKARLEVMRLIGREGEARWLRELRLTDEPTVPTDELAPLDDHVAVALRQRTDLNEARLRIEKGELDVVRTKNGLLPKLDFFISMGGSRYASAFGSTNVRREGRSRDVGAGLQLEYALGHRSERASYDRSRLALSQYKEALRNQEDLAQVDIRTAYLEAQRTAEQIEATRATRKYREETLRAENEKFRVGKSTSILVAQAHSDLIASRIAEVEAVVEQIKARLNLYVQDGSLTERRGIKMEK